MNEREFKEELQAINKKLDNHLIHIAADIAAINTNIDWIKENCRNKCSNQNKEQDSIQNTNIDWLKWIVQYLAIAVVGAALALIVQHFDKSL